MATRKKKKTPTKTVGQKKTESNGGMPEGFRSVISARADGYFRVEEGATIQGLIMGRFPRRDDPGFYYQLRLTKPCETVQKKDGDGGYFDTTGEIGEVISVDERAAMSGLSQPAEDTESKWEAFIRFKVKVKGTGGKSYWQADCGVRPAEGITFDDTPF